MAALTCPPRADGTRASGGSPAQRLHLCLRGRSSACAAIRASHLPAVAGLMRLFVMMSSLRVGAGLVTFLPGPLAAAPLHIPQFRRHRDHAAGGGRFGRHIAFTLSAAGSAARIVITVWRHARAGGDIAARSALTVTLESGAEARRVTLGRVTRPPIIRWASGADGRTCTFRSPVWFIAAEIGAAVAARDRRRSRWRRGASDDADLAGLRGSARRSAAAGRVEGRGARRGLVHQGIRWRGRRRPRDARVGGNARGTAGGSAIVAIDRLGARGRTRRASIRSLASRRAPSAAAGARPPSGRADRARTASGPED